MTPYDVVAAAETALSALTGPGEALEGVTIDVREPAAVDSQRDAAALAAGGLLILTPEAESVEGEQFGNTLDVALPLRLTLVARGKLQFADRAALGSKHGAREAIRLALHKTGLPGMGASVWDARYEPEPAYDVAGLDRQYRVSRQRFVYVESGPRSA